MYVDAQKVRGVTLDLPRIIICLQSMDAIRLLVQRRVVRWHDASIFVVFHAPLRSCINMHYYGLFGFRGYVLNKIRNCSHASVYAEEVRRPKNSEGQPLFRALHVQNGSIWYELEDLSCIPSLLSSVYKKCFR